MATIQIKQGDTLSALAQRFHTTVSALASKNGISNPDLIFAGAQLITIEIGSAVHRKGGTDQLPLTRRSCSEADPEP